MYKTSQNIFDTSVLANESLLVQTSPNTAEAVADAEYERRMLEARAKQAEENAARQAQEAAQAEYERRMQEAREKAASEQAAREARISEGAVGEGVSPEEYYNSTPQSPAVVQQRRSIPAWVAVGAAGVLMYIFGSMG